MSVRIRLRRMGAKKKPFYRIVVADSRRARDGRFIEQLGYYDPTTEPPTMQVDAEKAKKWIGNGAQPSLVVLNLLKKMGVIERTTPVAPVVEEAEKPVKKSRKKVAAEAAAAAAPKVVEEPKAAEAPAPAEAPAAVEEAAPAAEPEAVAEPAPAEEPEATEEAAPAE